MQNKIVVLVLVLVSTYASAQSVLRQRSTTEGFNVGIFGQFTSWSTTSKSFSDLADISSGGGGGIRLGYGLTQRIEPYVGFDYSQLSNPDLGDYLKTYMVHVDAGMRFNFGSTTKRLRPYADLAGSYVHTSITNIPTPYNNKLTTADLGLQGYGLTGALGLNYFITPMIALNVGYTQMLIGKFNQNVYVAYAGGPSGVVPSNEKILIGTGRLSAGITIYLSGRR